MTKLKVLIQGYAKKTKTGWLASCTTTLIDTGKHKIIVDPGINKELLLKKLADEKLTPTDIDYVFLTHYHLDHVLLAALFENATYFDGTTIYDKDKETEYSSMLPDTDIKVLATPGHANEHASLVVETKEFGTVVVGADVVWWTDDEKQEIDRNSILAKKDPFVVDEEALQKSREVVLETADWVVPGHGKMFRVKK